MTYKQTLEMRGYDDEDFISYSYRRHYEETTGKKIREQMNRHIRDQERRFNEAELEEQDERADEE